MKINAEKKELRKGRERERKRERERERKKERKKEEGSAERGPPDTNLTRHAKEDGHIRKRKGKIEKKETRPCLFSVLWTE